MQKIIMTVIVMVALFCAGFYVGKVTTKPKIQIVRQTEIKTQVVYRDKSTLTNEQIWKLLQCYDTSKPRLDIIIDTNTVTAKAGLCDRNWERTAYIEVGDDGMWKYYVGIGVIASGIIYLALR